MLIAGIGANLETDLKKVIALSTLSQLGLIVIAVALGLPRIAYFHILSHALFKALLFMCAGNIIHCNQDTQDIRKIGAIISQIPLTAACLNTANLALCGVPFIAGFYSKDIILEAIVFDSVSLYVIGIVYLATALTVIYSLRLRYYATSLTPNSPSSFNLNDRATFSRLATTPLILISIIGGATIS
jgi:NADH-ubiquinone oxidoreductase chain 5